MDRDSGKYAVANYRRISAILERITYKPNWKISLDPSRPYDTFGVQLYVTAVLRDAEDNERKPFMMTKRLPIFPLDCPDSYIVRHIGDAVRFAEDEQFKSWFRYDKFRIYEPAPKESQF